jgi:LPS-assembly lipoprotein
MLALFGLAGCGFRPLYGDNSAVGSVDLSRVRIAAIQDQYDPTGNVVSTARAGQRLRNYLLDRVTPRGRTAAALYELSVTLRESKSTIGIRSDESATRGTLTMTASYSLVRLDNGATMMTSGTRSDVSYNIVSDEFATLSAENDARRRATREIGDTISLDVASAVGAWREGVVK